ncbi:hypothetical protein K466DRAFT_506824 [Polyporus arcularius HHB13444]|uniref:CxC5 like cysteine cluster associated with KDZ domain-containing protein n=1 Tax=Polyporus arcularius HHB13444 TaxID=1314778 RepID=A0A5C3NNC1_9APHY|nr:hypothetical protein K466DRAFT_506824 [Polyporus arcularius HHB13444]
MIGAEVMVAPFKACFNPDCPDRGKPLGGDRKDYQGHLYTRRRGVLPIRIMTLYCRGCKTTYRPNYYVANASRPDAQRKYYGGIPEALEVTEHYYVESELVRLFRAQIAFAQTSGENVAHIYNLGLAGTLDSHPHPLPAAVVWNSFYLYSLLLYACHHTQSSLIVPHHGDQADRFTAALEARNLQIMGTGQPEWAHACDECEKIIAPERLKACVMDGINIGHPRCNVYHCTERLRSPRDRFCPEHSSNANFCAIAGCSEPVTGKMRTCELPAHRDYEVQKREQGKAYYRLKQRLEGRSLASIIRSASALSRKLTHNEQLMVCCCGIVIGRATFYEAESVSNAKRFIYVTFPPHYPRGRPSFIFFDNNCQLLRHLLANDDTTFDDIGLPVDVFHALTKHKDSDEFCALNCNPAAFPELRKGGEWVFNSSAAEQANVWFGKFLPIVREMGEVRYNFFLDEVIMMRNEERVKVLDKRGARPRLVPLEELQLPKA